MEYSSQILNFGASSSQDTLSLLEAAQRVRDGKACAILLDVFNDTELRALWEDDNFPEITQHKSFKGSANSGISIGPTQRRTGADFVTGIIDYFAYAGKWNEALKKSELVQFLVRELNAGFLTSGEWGEFPIASKRSYCAASNSDTSVPPHCDCIYFGRDERWPFKQDFVSDYDQLSLFVSVKEDDTDSSLVLWDHRVSSRNELDILMGEYINNGSIKKLDSVDSVRVRARSGQVSILNTRYVHAVEQCKTERQTMGSFMVWQNDRWKLFH